MANRSSQRLIAMLLLLAVSACTGPQPTLRSNKQLHLYGRQLAQQEIDFCQRQAEQSGLGHGTNQTTNAATGAVLGLTLGGAVGASAGAWGGLVGVAIGAAAGSALGFTVGLLGGTFKPLEPDPPYAEAVTKCLKDKGYEVSGWE
ncbi:MAG: hypothetical protein A4C66_12110 [Nitrospira sp. HN-bin3]|uniref:hypothetical protein n=1 Tax=Nitrospira cf. moscoviensis SBR1015 TaxID=96242 RepID=UPI000A0C5B7C|nr:hypothetical protein [Nitrospira cf. moscoviensis SBR1015]OQW38307.1 MAG: hypothetical protein A4C66_12110 [Nitrospira sp. HN-bin3]